jgi:hypothetical protein
MLNGCRVADTVIEAGGQSASELWSLSQHRVYPG